MRKTIIPVLISFVFNLCYVHAQSDHLRLQIQSAAEKIEQKVILWRHDIHEHPELGNREFRTAGLIARHLESLGMEECMPAVMMLM